MDEDTYDEIFTEERSTRKKEIYEKRREHQEYDLYPHQMRDLGCQTIKILKYRTFRLVKPFKAGERVHEKRWNDSGARCPLDIAPEDARII
jgi:hypothetical protein